ncbi:hypothetical protein TSUD_56980 [Trifolium subterraneum]|uniref:Bulb-type lectin domain-containing protein n=1 Tax=Trifolium subterraneum TaxID=3900 RepID=A0A2Z6MZ13_TRISU|nr:hypothetical protein TSUD_56980 [Trifolium subterraneum]
MVEPISLLFFFTLHLSVVTSAKFTIVNQCNHTVWPASYTTSGTATIATTGFILKPGENSTITVPAKWTGRFWGRTLCTTDSISGNFSCVTGDCGSGNLESLDNQGGSVSVGESLIAGSRPTQWISPSGDFAFGFYKLPNELFLLAIWYVNIQTDAIIWYANGDNPAPKGSRLVLNDSHGLVLTNPQGLELWRSNFTSGTISTGIMNDAGNFQLRDENSVAIWDSFSYPTDTLLPTQVMELNGSLSSREGAFNFSRGRFKLHLQGDGNLVLNLINLPSNYSYDPYYSSDINSDDKNQSNVGQRLIFDKSVLLGSSVFVILTLLGTKRLDNLLENDNYVGNDKMSLEKLVMIVIWCIQEDPSLRPTMKEVLLMLEGIVEVFVPPSPYLYGSVSCN